MEQGTRAQLVERYTARSGTHTESGPDGVGSWLELYADHAHNHADQIRRPGVC